MALELVQSFLSSESPLADTLAALEPCDPEDVCTAVWVFEEKPVSSPETTARLQELVQALAPLHHDVLASMLSLETLEKAGLFTSLEKSKTLIKRVNTNQKVSHT
jgi:hypothetical protein